jgi:ethanolamine ammonia-lyase small subunit
VLDFAIAHAVARDAVHSSLDADALKLELEPLGVPILQLSTLAPDRQTYLRRPDLGRRLDSGSKARLAAPTADQPDVVLIIADGLSAPAPQRHSAAVLRELLPKLTVDQVRIGPICIVRQARVAVQDEIGLALGAKVAVILIGERPGLGTDDSLGAYLVFDPQVGRIDAQRNCVSNIRPGGLSPPAAAATLHYLIAECLRRRISGVGLKDDRRALLPDSHVPHLPA